MIKLKHFFGGGGKIPYSFVTTPGPYLVAPGFNPYPQDPYGGRSAGSGSQKSDLNEYEGLTAHDANILATNDFEAKMLGDRANNLYKKYEQSTDSDERKSLDDEYTRTSLLKIALEKSNKVNYGAMKMKTAAIAKTYELDPQERDKPAIFSGEGGAYDVSYTDDGRMMTVNDWYNDYMGNVDSRFYNKSEVIQPFATNGKTAQEKINERADRIANIFNTVDNSGRNSNGSPIVNQLVGGDGTIANIYTQYREKSNETQMNALTNAMTKDSDYAFDPETQAAIFQDYLKTTHTVIKQDDNGKPYYAYQGRLKRAGITDMSKLSADERKELEDEGGVYDPKSGIKFHQENGAKEVEYTLKNGKKVMVTPGIREETFNEYLTRRVLATVKPMYSYENQAEFKTFGSGSNTKDQLAKGTEYTRNIYNLANLGLDLNNAYGNSIRNLNPNEKDAFNKDIAAARVEEARRLTEAPLGDADREYANQIIKEAEANNTTPGMIIQMKQLQIKNHSPLSLAMMTPDSAGSNLLLYYIYKHKAKDQNNSLLNSMGNNSQINLLCATNYVSPTVKYSIFEKSYTPAPAVSDATSSVIVSGNITLYTNGVDYGTKVSSSDVPGGLYVSNVNKISVNVPTIEGFDQKGEPIYGENQTRLHPMIIATVEAFDKMFPNGINIDSPSEKIWVYGKGGKIHTELFPDGAKNDSYIEPIIIDDWVKTVDVNQFNDAQQKAFAAFVSKNQGKKVMGLRLMTDKTWADKNDYSLHPKEHEEAVSDLVKYNKN